MCSFPYQSGQVYSELCDKGFIEAERASESGWELTLRLPAADADYYQRFALERAK